MPWERKNPVVLTEDQKAFLIKTTQTRSEELRRVQRATILLMASKGETDGKIADEVHLNKNSVRNTINKFTTMGLSASLNDLARSGRPALIDDEAKAWVKSQACIQPKDLGLAQELWTVKTLTNHIHANCSAAGHEVLLKIAPPSVWRLLEHDQIKPHRIRYYLERCDPEHDLKMKQVLMVYKEVELQLTGVKDSNDIIISYDEKPGIQAIANVAPDRPPNGRHGFISRDYEYKRLGTVSLLSGINLVSGEVTGLVRDSHKSADFIDFLKVIDEQHKSSNQIKLVLDNHIIHSSKEAKAYLATRPGRFEFIFTPKHASWLNQIESFFGKLTRICLKGIRVGSKEELVDRIYMYLNEVNAAPVIPRWKYKMDEIEV
jgi:transposase